MTVCVLYNGILAADTSTIQRDSGLKLKAVKLHRCNNKFIVDDEKTLTAKWLCFSGSSNMLAGALRMLSANGTLNEFAESISKASSLIDGSMSLGFLMDDGTVCNISNTGKLVTYAKDKRLVDGRGAVVFKEGYDPDKILSAPELAWIAARLVNGCGGDVLYATPESDELRVFNPNKQSLKRMTAVLTKQLLNRYN